MDIEFGLQDIYMNIKISRNCTFGKVDAIGFFVENTKNFKFTKLIDFGSMCVDLFYI